MRKIILIALTLVLAPFAFAFAASTEGKPGDPCTTLQLHPGHIDTSQHCIADAGSDSYGSSVPRDSTFKALAPIPGLTDDAKTSAVSSDSLANFFNNLYKYLIGVAAVAAVVQLTFHGIRIALNRDNVAQLLDSKGRVYNALFGLLLVLSPVLVFSLINPSILNLSLNIPTLDTSNIKTPFNPNDVPMPKSTKRKANGESCGSNVECDSAYCSEKNVCEDHNECYPEASGYPQKSCNEGYECVAAGTGQFYSCVKKQECLDSLPEGFSDACSTPNLTKWCPAETEDKNQCYVNSSQKTAICASFKTGCPVLTKEPTFIRLIK